MFVFKPIKNYLKYSLFTLKLCCYPSVVHAFAVASCCHLASLYLVAVVGVLAVVCCCVADDYYDAVATVVVVAVIGIYPSARIKMVLGIG